MQQNQQNFKPAREIRFRAWDDVRNFMVYDFYNIEHPAAIEYFLSANNGILEINCQKANGDWYTLEPMDCVGLKDKNEKYIYDGDILKHNGRLFIVRQSENLFHFVINEIARPTNWRNLEWVNNVKKYIEVIGNIYQNAELIPGAVAV